MAAFVPEAGDFVWLTFDPKAGSKAYNAKSGLALACPITNQSKGYPFEVASSRPWRCWRYLSDHLKSIGWKARRVERLGHCPNEVIEEVRAKLATLLWYYCEAGRRVAHS
jgi:mRNA interferase MazF